MGASVPRYGVRKNYGDFVPPNTDDLGEPDLIIVCLCKVFLDLDKHTGQAVTKRVSRECVSDKDTDHCIGRTFGDHLGYW